MVAANLAFRFLLELCLLAAVAYWGAGAGSSTGKDVALAIVAPLGVAVVWGLVVAPKARFRLPLTWWVLVQLLLFGIGVAALIAAGAPLLGAVFGVLAGVNLSALIALRGPDVQSP